MTWIDKLKKRYNLDSNLELVLVLVLFTVTGSTAAWVGRELRNILGITNDVSPWLFWPFRILTIFILYQMLFVIYGYIIGLFKNKVWEFAWWFEKKMLSRFGIKFKESEK